MKKLMFSILMILLFGCGGEKSDRDTDAVTPQPVIETRVGMTKIMPLEVGAMWVYQVSGYDTTLNQLRPFKVDTFHVIKDTLINNVKWYEINGLAGERALATNLGDGLYYAHFGFSPFLFIKYPLAVGDTFSSRIGQIQTVTQLAATGLEINTPAGNFYCHKYSQAAGPMKIITNYYLAPGVGLIKLEILDPAGKFPMAENKLIAIHREKNSRQ